MQASFSFAQIRVARRTMVALTTTFPQTQVEQAEEYKAGTTQEYKAKLHLTSFTAVGVLCYLFKSKAFSQLYYKVY
jgi:hypothetical protein